MLISPSAPAPSIAQWIHDGDSASPALLELLQVQLSTPLVEYICQHVADAIAEEREIPKNPSFLLGRRRSLRRTSTVSSQHLLFASNVLAKSKATMPCILAALVYIDRVGPRLQIVCKEYAFERVFLGALMVARKFTHDCNYRCKHWSSFTGLFGPRDISRIEREFLEVLKFDLTFTEGDLLQHHDGITAASMSLSSRTSSPASRPSSPSRISVRRRRSLIYRSADSHFSSHPLYSTHPDHTHFISLPLKNSEGSTTSLDSSPDFKDSPLSKLAASSAGIHQSSIAHSHHHHSPHPHSISPSSDSSCSVTSSSSLSVSSPESPSSPLTPDTSPLYEPHKESHHNKQIHGHHHRHSTHTHVQKRSSFLLDLFRGGHHHDMTVS